MRYRNPEICSSNRIINDSFNVNCGARDGLVSRIIHHTSSSEVSVVSVRSEARSCRPAGTFSRRNDIPAFTSLRQLVKPSAGVTIVNVYNNPEQEAKTTKYKQPKCAKPSLKKSPEKKEIKKDPVPVEPTQRSDLDEQHICLATDEERRRALKVNDKVLPHWHRSEAAAGKNLIYADDYNEQKAKRDWDSFYAAKRGAKKQMNNNMTKSAKSSKENTKESNSPCDSELAVSLTAPVKQTKTPSSDKSEEPQEHACGAFYGTAETERVCMNAIQHILKAERELQLLQFTSNNVLPQTKQCLEKVRWVHECLKLFNTHFRDLQAETDERLQKKAGNHFTINMRPPPKNDLPFPAHI